MKSAAHLAQEHWNETPLLVSEHERYSNYPWLFNVAEFDQHHGDYVLEIGCGTGCDLLQFAKHGAIATGVDITREHIQHAKRRVADSATVLYGDARCLPFANESFDYVYSHGVLHHSDAPRAFAAEIMRVLKPGGRFNVHVYARWSTTTASAILRFRSKWKLHVENSTKPVHLELYTARALRKLFPVPLTIEKYGLKRLPWLQHLWGWFLVGKGRRPG